MRRIRWERVFTMASNPLCARTTRPNTHTSAFFLKNNGAAPTRSIRRSSWLPSGTSGSREDSRAKARLERPGLRSPGVPGLPKAIDSWMPTPLSSTATSPRCAEVTRTTTTTRWSVTFADSRESHLRPNDPTKVKFKSTASSTTGKESPPTTRIRPATPCTAPSEAPIRIRFTETHSEETTSCPSASSKAKSTSSSWSVRQTI